jgi:hypothetical protein
MAGEYRSGDSVKSQVIGGPDVPGTIRPVFWVTFRRVGGVTWRRAWLAVTPALDVVTPLGTPACPDPAFAGESQHVEQP